LRENNSLGKVFPRKGAKPIERRKRNQETRRDNFSLPLYNSRAKTPLRMELMSRQNWLCVLLTLLAGFTGAAAKTPRAGRPASAIPTEILVKIIRAEDERRWDEQVAFLLADKNAKIRERATLAAGRIGNERAVSGLIDLLKKDADFDVQRMAAFALGEIESVQGADALIEAARTPEVRARALEALGKIAAALPQTEESRRQAIGRVILNALTAERTNAGRTAGGVSDLSVELLGLTATMRAHPTGAEKVAALYLSSPDPRVRADAANTLARLRAKEGLDQLRRLLVEEQSPISRANAARALGAAEDKQAFDALLDRALHDNDLRVRVSAIRALGSLKDARAAQPLTERIVAILRSVPRRQVTSAFTSGSPAPRQNELLELLTSIGNIEAAKGGDLTPYSETDPRKRPLPRDFAQIPDFSKLPSIPFFKDPEFHVAAAKINPADYMQSAYLDPLSMYNNGVFKNWRYASGIAQGLRTISTLSTEKYGNDILRRKEIAEQRVHAMLNDKRLPKIATSDVLTSFVAFKPSDASKVLREFFKSNDVVVRSTSAELLGEQTPNEANARALIVALKAELPRIEKGEMNDAALANLDALAKQKSKEANDAIKMALDSSDHLIRRKAVTLLKANGVGDFSDHIGTVKTRNTEADYRRAIARIGRKVTATVVTSKGTFTIDFLPEDAPLTVDNFIQLARKGFFNGQTIPRVVPNFVIQAGDPRGDTNGGPGYQIRCEINEVPYERGAVGMALSGKDTGGSQWFVTHSPQPHLDGGYTVFGRVIRGMEVVDNIARGDTIRRVIVNER
jgi:cyclophilin family peptidyl-prolyl cis-trans isomerase/HEAT repeat protein